MSVSYQQLFADAEPDVITVSMTRDCIEVRYLWHEKGATSGNFPCARSWHRRFSLPFKGPSLERSPLEHANHRHHSPSALFAAFQATMGSQSPHSRYLHPISGDLPLLRASSHSSKRCLYAAPKR